MNKWTPSHNKFGAHSSADVAPPLLGPYCPGVSIYSLGPQVARVSRVSLTSRAPHSCGQIGNDHRYNSRPSGQLLTKGAISGTEKICNMYLHRTESDQYNTRAPVPAGSAPTPRSPRGPQHHRCPTRVVRRQVATYVPAPRLSFPLLWLTHRDLD